jgi:hypothetical protein
MESAEEDDADVVCMDKNEITIEPVYFEKKSWLRKYIDPKKMAKYSFYGAFCAILFIYYVKIMSHPLIAFLYMIGTTLVLSYSVFVDSSYLSMFV